MLERAWTRLWQPNGNGEEVKGGVKLDSLVSDLSQG